MCKKREMTKNRDVRWSLPPETLKGHAESGKLLRQIELMLFRRSVPLSRDIREYKEKKKRKEEDHGEKLKTNN